VAEHVCSKMGRAAARPNAPKQPRAIRAGPHPGEIFFGPPIPGVHLIFPHTGGLSVFPQKSWVYLRSTSGGDFFWTPNTGGSSDFSTYRGFICLSPKIRGFIWGDTNQRAVTDCCRRACHSNFCTRGPSVPSASATISLCPAVTVVAAAAAGSCRTLPLCGRVVRVRSLPSL